MTQQPSQNKQILQKLDEVISSVNVINNKVSRMETQIEMQPRIDIEKHAVIFETLKSHDARIANTEKKFNWLGTAVFGYLIIELLKLI